MPSEIKPDQLIPWIKTILCGGTEDTLEEIYRIMRTLLELKQTLFKIEEFCIMTGQK